MTGFALALVLSAAFLHASWNYLLKRAGGGFAFVFLFASLSAAIYAPLACALFFYQRPHLGWPELGFIVASGAIHTAYYLLLDRGYRSGDLSLVYPLARGTGPLLTLIVAIALLQERPSAVAIAGSLFVVGGAVTLTGSFRKLMQSADRHAVGFALLTGASIAAYTLIDKLAVSALLIPPLIQDWGANLIRAALMSPLAMLDKSALRSTWRKFRREIAAVAILCPLSYILVLTAMVFTPVSYVAPAREISILIAALMGARLLAEQNVKRRIAAACAMVLGVIALALG